MKKTILCPVVALILMVSGCQSSRERVVRKSPPAKPDGPAVAEIRSTAKPVNKKSVSQPAAKDIAADAPSPNANPKSSSKNNGISDTPNEPLPASLTTQMDMQKAAVENFLLAKSDSRLASAVGMTGEPESQPYKRSPIQARISDVANRDSPLNISSKQETEENVRKDGAVSPAGYDTPAPPESPVKPSETARDEPTKNPVDVDWETSADQAIRALTSRLNAKDPKKRISEKERVRFELKLRFLQFARGNFDEAVEPIAGLDDSHQEFVSNQLYGMHIYGDDENVPNDEHRNALALRHLRNGLNKLATNSKLDLRNVTFCTDVNGFGDFEEFKRSVFQPKKQMLLYVEVDNFAVEEVPGGFETELRGSYQILDRAGRRVFPDHQLPIDREVCRNHRRDYYIAYFVYLPDDIDPGNYTLQLTVEDVKGKKFGQSSIDFSIAN